MDLFGETAAPVAEVVLPEALQVANPEEVHFDHPRLMSEAQGHGSVEVHLLDLFNSERMPHGLVFAGPKGIGKATTAYRLARFLLKHGAANADQDSLFGDAPAVLGNLDVERSDKVSSLIVSGGHPDFLSIERAYDVTKNKLQKGVSVAEIRKVAPFLRKTSSEGGWRVVIIDDADTMNRNAQNALLKILEEPPKKTILILVAHRIGALIPTIRSRTQSLSFSSPSQDIFEPILRQFDPDIDPTHLDVLYRLTRGSIGNSIEYLEDEGLEMLSRLLDLFKAAPHWSWPDIHKLGNELGRNGKENAYKNFTALMLWVLTEMVSAKARGTALPCDALVHPAIAHMMAHSSLEKLLDICENMQDHFAQVERTNLDKKQAVLRAFSIISA